MGPRIVLQVYPGGTPQVTFDLPAREKRGARVEISDGVDWVSLGGPRVAIFSDGTLDDWHVTQTEHRPLQVP